MISKAPLLFLAYILKLLFPGASAPVFAYIPVEVMADEGTSVPIITWFNSICLTNSSSAVDKFAKSNPVASNKSVKASFEGANTV